MKPKFVHTIIEADVGQSHLNLTKTCEHCGSRYGDLISVSNLMGRIYTTDIGKRIYAVRNDANTAWGVPGREQRTARYEIGDYMLRSMPIQLGTIRGFHGTWGSGISQLEIEDADGQITMVPCDNGETARSLEAAFGDVIAPNHNVDEAGGHIGQGIYWTWDEMGLMMAGFMPIDEAGPELIEEYERQT